MWKIQKEHQTLILIEVDIKSRIYLQDYHKFNLKWTHLAMEIFLIYIYFLFIIRVRHFLFGRMSLGKATPQKRIVKMLGCGSMIT